MEIFSMAQTLLEKLKEAANNHQSQPSQQTSQLNQVTTNTNSLPSEKPSQERSNGPSHLPPTPRKPKQQSQTIPTIPTTNQAAETTSKKLPEDPKEFDRVLAPYRIMVRPLISGVSKVAEFSGTPKLDNDEIEGGTQAFSALMYQYGGALDARVLVALWIAGVTMPRVLYYLKEKERENERKPTRLTVLDAVKAEKEKRENTVEGSVVK